MVFYATFILLRLKIAVEYLKWKTLAVFLKYNVKYFNALIYPASVLDSFVRTVEHVSSFIPMEYIFY
jgi:hypothetical protein